MTAAGLAANGVPVERLVGGDGREVARVARDAAGARILESSRFAVVDVVDAEPAQRRLGWTLFAVMFGASAPRGRSTAADPLASLRAWVAADAGRGARVYRTAGGHRVLVTSPELDAASDDADQALRRIGADGGARRSSREEGCFRVPLDPAGRFVEALGRAPDGDAAMLVEWNDRLSRT